ncbi:hypothetical protein [Psittacicella hinzii]|uniref:Uncharacterized protein n=1 Tax=Psittacicella hinzii TaxID=2028575 RepID=A0A3A1YPQ5_9GAMM|nr:hypothetical protein [Psittacicella hinzii]RIY39486.1 hypothetical protein CKF58_02155 [Psittacicella hinzii]
MALFDELAQNCKFYELREKYFWQDVRINGELIKACVRSNKDVQGGRGDFLSSTPVTEGLVVKTLLTNLENAGLTLEYLADSKEDELIYTMQYGATDDEYSLTDFKYIRPNVYLYFQRA